MLSAYSCNSSKTVVRFYNDDNDLLKIAPFDSDVDRIVQANSFKRLQHKTQVFFERPNKDSLDHYRNRMTHSLEVALISRFISKSLGIVESVAEAISLAHDIGHPPFGHVGEDVLDECCNSSCGFYHNNHALRLIVFLEQKYINHNGLNLTWGVLDGIVKHNGPVIDTRRFSSDVIDHLESFNIKLNMYPCLEAQVSSVSDDIAYITHDIEDALLNNLISLDQVYEVTKNCPINYYSDEVNYPASSSQNTSLGNDLNINGSKILTHRIIYNISRMLRSFFIADILKMTQNNISAYKIKREEDVRELNVPVVDFSENCKKEINKIRDFLFKNVYNSDSVTLSRKKCKTIIKDLFKVYTENVSYLPFFWQHRIMDQSDVVPVIVDYIAGMTDRFALEKHSELFK